MDKIHDTPVASASDVVGFVSCPHLTELDLAVAEGKLQPPVQTDEMMEMLRERGLDHERAHLEHYEANGAVVVDVELSDRGAAGRSSPAARERRLAELAAATVDAMRQGVDVIYQAAFFDRSGRIWWRGHADFLRKVDQSTGLGGWGYEPEDTKLSTHASAWAALQLSFYADLVTLTQQSAVRSIHIVLGSGEPVSLRTDEFGAYFRMVRAHFERAVLGRESSYPLPNAHCRVCRWAARCHQRWENDDHLVRVANLSVEQAKKLQAAGIPTLTDLAVSPPTISVPGIGQETMRRLQQQARLQHAAIPGEPPPWEFVEPFEEEMGLASLPAPDPGDVFYDIEGHPYAASGGLEYLHGLEWLERGAPKFEGWWAFDENEERLVFERIIDFIVQRRKRFANMHVYHYAPYEVTALKRLMSKYGTREQEMDELLRAEVFVDLYRVVRHGVRVGTSSYSIKRLEPLYMPARDDEIGDGGSSIVAFERWLQTRNQQILDDILAYNTDDVVSNRMLRSWLEDRRSEAVLLGLPAARPQATADASKPTDPELAALIAQLNLDRRGGDLL